MEEVEEVVEVHHDQRIQMMMNEMNVMMETPPKVLDCPPIPLMVTNYLSLMSLSGPDYLTLSKWLTN
jgi:hypothetical protein